MSSLVSHLPFLLALAPLSLAPLSFSLGGNVLQRRSSNRIPCSLARTVPRFPRVRERRTLAGDLAAKRDRAGATGTEHPVNSVRLISTASEVTDGPGLRHDNTYPASFFLVRLRRSLSVLSHTSCGHSQYRSMTRRELSVSCGGIHGCSRHALNGCACPQRMAKSRYVAMNGGFSPIEMHSERLR